MTVDSTKTVMVSVDSVASLLVENKGCLIMVCVEWSWTSLVMKSCRDAICGVQREPVYG